MHVDSSAAVRFWRRVEKTETCWLWKASNKRGKGYGSFSIAGKIYSAHRVSWVISNGQIPDGLYVLHKCDVRNCVNPAHLFLGTNSDNIADMVRKGRQKKCGIRGSKNHFSKLTEADILIIRARLQNETSVAVARDYGIALSNIGYIKTGKTWRHVAVASRPADCG